MKIQIKKSIKPVDYNKAMSFIDKRLKDIQENKHKELIWLLEHKNVYTAGTSSTKDEIIDKKINIVKTNRGGKITFHGPGQIIFYFIINLNKRKKDIRWFLNCIERSIINTLKSYKINTYSDKKNIGIWTNHNNKEKKIASIGIKVSKWYAYHGYALNVNVDKEKFKKIIPCGIKNKEIVNLSDIKKKKFINLKDNLIKNFILNLKN